MNPISYLISIVVRHAGVRRFHTFRICDTSLRRGNGPIAPANGRPSRSEMVGGFARSATRRSTLSLRVAACEIAAAIDVVNAKRPGRKPLLLADLLSAGD